MAIPLALLQGLAGAAKGIMPQGFSLAPQLAGAAAGGPAMGSSLGAGPAAAPAVAPAAAPSAPSYSLPPHLEGGGGAHDGGGGGYAPQVANISPGAAGATVGAGIPSLGNIVHTSSMTPEPQGSGNEPPPVEPRPGPILPQGSSINPFTQTASNVYMNGTGGANANADFRSTLMNPPTDRSMSPYAPGISKGAGDYMQNPGAGLPGPDDIGGLIQSLPGEPRMLSPDYNPGPGNNLRLAAAGPPSWLGGTGGTSGLSATGYPGGYPTGTLTPADAQAAPFSVAPTSRTVSPTSVPGSYQPPGYLGGTGGANALDVPALSPTSQPGFYHPPSLSAPPSDSGTDLYHGTITPADLGIFGPSPAAATPSYGGAGPQVPGGSAPPGYNPYINTTGGVNALTAPIPQARPPQTPQPRPPQERQPRPEGGPSPYGTARVPQPAPPTPPGYQFEGNLPAPRPTKGQIAGFTPYSRPGTGYNPYGYDAQLPRGRPEYINPYGYLFGGNY